MTFGYIRVSTDQQTVENQRFEINQYCEKHGMKIDGWIEETISVQRIPKSANQANFLKRYKVETLLFVLRFLVQEEVFI